MSRCAVLVSGGVDSSVVLARLKAEGQHELTAFYLKIWLEDEMAYMGECPWEEDLSYVTAVCAQLKVPLEVVSLQREYWDRVVTHTVTELRQGRTPSPDILCNQHIKFGAFWERAGRDFDYVASGHYAQTVQRDGLSWLCRGADPIKDQTYFLSHLSQAQLSRAIFPIGHLPKPAVRALAADLALPNRDRPDSQGICFLGKIPYNEFVRYHLGEAPGPIIELATGKVLGEHRGAWFHTIGQRKGLGLSGGPWFVVDKNLSERIVYVAPAEIADARATAVFEIASINWLSLAPTAEMSLSVKVRHGERRVAAQLADLGAGRYQVTMAAPDRGIAAGQYAVLYAGEYCLGGGVIQELR